MPGSDHYRNLVRVSRATAFRDLEEWVRHGPLVRTGIGRGTRYCVAVDLRRCSRMGQLDAARGEAALEDLAGSPIVRYPHLPFLPRIRELKHGVTAYDAAYLALSEALAAPLVTRDAKLAATVGHRARVELARPEDRASKPGRAKGHAVPTLAATRTGTGGSACPARRNPSQ